MNPPRTEIRDLEDLFVYDLQAVYDMELKLVDELGELSRLATNDDLSKGFAVHRTETQTQVRRIEEAFEALGEEPSRRDDEVVDGLLGDRERFDAAVTDEGVRNVRYLVTATKTERIEITSYEGLLMTAERADLGDDVTGPLEENLGQEEKTLRKLEGLSSGTDLESIWNDLIGS